MNMDSTSIVSSKDVARLMSPSNVNLFIFFCGVSPMHLIPHPPRLERRFPQPFLLPRRDWPIEG
jgi:hypothetical protein